MNQPKFHCDHAWYCFRSLRPFVMALLIVLLGSAVQAAEQLSPRDILDLPSALSVLGEGKSGPAEDNAAAVYYPKLSPLLNRLVDSYSKKGLDGTRQFIEENKLRSEEDLVEIILVIASPDPLEELDQEVIARLELRIRATGGIAGNHAFNYLQAWLPVQSLPEAAGWEEVELVREPTLLPTLPREEGQTRDLQSSAITTEGLSLIGATPWHTAGLNGLGVRVGIIDTGFRNYQSLLGTELPAGVTTRVCGTTSDFTSTEHGTACAEIVHDIAPNADLFLVNVVNVEVDFSNAVNWLRSQGVDAISCSIAPNWIALALAGGVDLQLVESQLNAAVNSAVSSNISWSQAAGNLAMMFWSGRFSDPNGDKLHEWAGDPTNNISYSSSAERVAVVLIWDDPQGASSNDYDLLIVDNQTGQIVTSSTGLQNGNDDPIEACVFTPVSGKSYGVAVGKYSGAVRNLALLEFETPSFEGQLEYYSPQASILPPGDNPNVATVGAVAWNNYSVIEPFSSQGPTTTGLVKPDLVAPDRISTWSIRPFYGTSASAPHVAGASALVLQAYPQYSPAQVKSFLESRATDLGSPRKDNVFGSGLVRLGTAPATSRPPVAAFTASPLSGAVPLAVQFTDQSTNSPTYWAWNFGDGGTSGLKNPAHTYTSAGTYTVSLTAANAAGSDVETKSGYIVARSQAAQTGTIAGIVSDAATGGGVGEATVTATPGNYATTTETVTPFTEGGGYTLANLPAGTYTVSVTATGYTPKSTPNIQVRAGQTTTLNITLTRTGGSSYAYSYFLPYFTDLAGYWTGVALSNSRSNQAANVNVAVYGMSGQALQSQDQTLSPDGQWVSVVTTGTGQYGWVLVRSDQPLTGLCFFGTPSYMADISLIKNKSSLLHIPHVAQNNQWDTWVLICNPNAAANTVTLTYTNQAGQSVPSKTFSVPAMGSIHVPLTSLLSGATVAGGKVKVSATQGVAAFALYTNLKTGQHCYAGISAVEPQ